VCLDRIVVGSKIERGQTAAIQLVLEARALGLVDLYCVLLTLGMHLEICFLDGSG
jgi:hypothetical protein